VSDVDEHLYLFKADWIRDPTILRENVREAKLNDLFTAEIAAWCAEIHEHLRELEAELGVELMLMGGNAASLRFDAVEQRGSRDNDYLTVASRADIARLMSKFAERFAVVPGYLEPTIYTPKNPVPELDMVAYEIPVPLRINHGNATNNKVKVEFHFEEELPPAETVSGALGPARGEMTARLPGLPYQIVLKLMTLAADPVGIDEEHRSGAVPRQMYDLDLLIASIVENEEWEHLTSYSARRHRHECTYWKVNVGSGEPWDGIRARLLAWSDCVDEAGARWVEIHSIQQAQLRREVHLSPWGWRGRALRLIFASECMRLGAGGWDLWQRAVEVSSIVPRKKAKAYKGVLATLPDTTASTLPLELHDYVWQALALGGATPIARRLDEVEAMLRSVQNPAT
jgi:hypothetical protein